MGITTKQINELVKITTENMPLPSVLTLLSATNIEMSEWETNSVIDFIGTNYTVDEILKGIDEHIEQCNFVCKLFSKEKE